MKKSIIFALVLCGIATFSVAQAKQWQLNRSGKTYTVDFNKQGNHLSGSYIGTNNDSVFEGNVYSVQGVFLVNFTQIDNNGFYAVYSGVKQGNQYSGHWYSTSGDSGNFVLSKTNQGNVEQPEVIKPTYEQAELDTQLTDFYQQWKANYLRQGCGDGRYYVDAAGDGKTVEGGTADSTLSISEGHGYGMLITVMMAEFDPNAQDIFNGMVSFFHDHPAKSNPGLMAWNQLRTCQNAGEDVGGDNSATDGDLDIAYALLLADSQWGSTGDINYRVEADKVISAIKQLEIDPVSQFVRIGDWVDRVDDSQYAHTTRSSDFMVSHFKAFADISGDNSWYLVRDQTYSIINHIRNTFSQDTSLIPDFIVDVPSNPRPAEPNFIEGTGDGEYSWNAVRYPWRIALDYILYNEQRAYDALAPMNSWIKNSSGGDPKNIAETYTLDGWHSVESGFDSMASVSMFAVAATIDASNQQWLDDLWLDINQKSINDEDYYGNTLKLLSMIAITGHWQKP